MQSDATTVADYLASLPEDRRTVIAALRSAILKGLPKGFEEAMNWGMISYQVPLAIEPKTYNGQPLSYAALAAQKNNYSVYYMCDGGEGKLAALWNNPKKKLDMGKACLRFKALTDIDLNKLTSLIASTPIDEFVALARR